MWGVGLVQNFNNAATEWYLGYRNFSLDINSDAMCTRPAPNAAAPRSVAGTGACGSFPRLQLGRHRLTRQVLIGDLRGGNKRRFRFWNNDEITYTRMP